jgi:hypothetical protein
MSTGISLLNEYGERVLDENHEVYVVTQKGTISGTAGAASSINEDTGGKWKILYGGTPPYQYINSYIANTYLTVPSSQKPLLAVRISGGAPGIIPRAYIRRHSSADFNIIRFQTFSAISMDYIILEPSSNPASLEISDDDYGVQIRKVDSSLVYDSRWIDQAAIVDSHPYGGTITTVPAPGTFFTTESLLGYTELQAEDLNTEPGAPPLLVGGGFFYPSLNQVNATTIQSTTVKEREAEVIGTPAGEVVHSSPISGRFMIVRYLNF